MDTLRVDICYRPLRIGWAIKSNDFQAFRQAVRYSYALWGGRYNPIIFIDQIAESKKLIDLFRLDVILPIGKGEDIKNFPKKYPYINKPFYNDSVFNKGTEYSDPDSYVLDIHNLLVFLKDKPEWKRIKEHGFQVHSWSEDDPLADMFLSQFGGFPDKNEIGRDYLDLVKKVSEYTEISLIQTAPIPDSIIDHPSLSYLANYGLKRHYGINRGWKSPGFFVGNVKKLEDLVCHWNLKACDLSLLFVDLDNIERYKQLLPAWEKAMKNKVANYHHEWDRKIAVWTMQEDLDNACKPFSESKLIRCRVSSSTWNGLNLQAPMMYFDEITVLGVVSGESDKPKVSFSLSDKPFCGDTWFDSQHLVASISLLGGLYGDEQHTFQVPFLPELNEFYARTMHFEYDKLRIEPGRIGIVIDAADHDSFLYALPVSELMTRIFELAGYKTKLSNAGLITKQLISRLGGVQGGRVFKVPGVRRLLKTYGPNATITKKTALQFIGSKDPARPGAKFSDHENLFIESRPFKKKLTTQDVFSYIVNKGLFRIGADLKCPSCKLNSWFSLNTLKHHVVCELCEHEFDITRKLTDLNELHYRRSGVLGVEKNTHGAVPVCLTLQQLDTSFLGGLGKNIYSPSLELSLELDDKIHECETDFVWIISGTDSMKTTVILAECKDVGPINEEDVINLKRVADSFPKERFETFIVLSKIPPFTKDEIEISKMLNDEYKRRVILLTAKELEPYHIREASKEITDKRLRWNSPKEMADSTFELYFMDDEKD